MVYEKESKLLTQVERRMRANEFLYGDTGSLNKDRYEQDAPLQTQDFTSQFTVGYDLTKYNQILDRYADIPTVGSLAAEDMQMQAYNPEPILSQTFRPEIHIPVIEIEKPEAVAEVATKTVTEDELKTIPPVTNIPTQTTTPAHSGRVNVAPPPPTRQWKNETDTAADVGQDGSVYVLKMKSPLLIASACAAVVLILLTSLLVINAISIATGAAELANYEQQLKIADDKYVAAELAAEQARKAVIEELQAELAAAGSGYTPLPVGYFPADVKSYQAPIDYESKTNAFDIICEFFSKLFG